MRRMMRGRNVLFLLLLSRALEAGSKPLGGRRVGPSGASFGPLGALLEASWGPLGGLLGPLGSLLGPSWVGLPLLGSSWGGLGALLGCRGSRLGRLGALLG
eukprot:9447157-Pyramimonas_sp.AAC.1